MAYSYSSRYGVSAAAASAAGGGYPSLYSRLAPSDPYIPEAYVGSSRYLSDADKYPLVLDPAYRGLSRAEIGAVGGYPPASLTAAAAGGSWSGIDGLSAISPGLKRTSDALYNQTILGSHSTIGQSEALYSTNSLVKHPRIETTSNLTVYPQRPGEKDCFHYMMTRTCKFGAACKYDHPLWVPEGGVPDWKEVPLMTKSESFPERPGEPDCPFYLKTQNCKYGPQCKFNHPNDKVKGLSGGVAGEGTEAIGKSVLPERPSEPICQFYMKSGTCKFGGNCKFHHPKDIQVFAGDGSTEKNNSITKVQNVPGSDPVKVFVPFTPASLHNSKGFPIRPGETDCPFYLKTGSCKYGAVCRYNHPERIITNPQPVGGAIAQSMLPPTAALPLGVMHSAINFIPSIDPRYAQATFTVPQAIYPQRPGEVECDFYMKTGQCKFSERCRFHHPVDRTAPTAAAAKNSIQQNVKLSLAGLPRREDQVACPYYMKTGACKYGAACRFDHPPPGEAILIATEQAKVVDDDDGESEGGESD